jgi:hypothetical protein
MVSSTRRLQMVAAAVSFVFVSLLVLRVSTAAFSAQTDNSGNAWAAGQVALSDSRGTGSAMFDVTGMVPGQTVSRCINVTFTGDANPVRVSLYAEDVAGDLAPHLNVTVTEGSVPDGSYPNCTGWSADHGVTVNAMPLATMATTHDTWADGAGTWEPAAGTHSRGYRIDVTLDAATPESAQGDTAGATFTWEVRTVAS